MKAIKAIIATSRRLSCGMVWVAVFLNFPALAFSQPLLDSLTLWKEQRAFSKICHTADQLLSGKEEQLQKCAKATFLIEAGQAAVDLFKPTQALGYTKAALVSGCRDSLLIMSAKMGSATVFNLLMKLDSAVLLTQEVIDFAESRKEEDLLIRANNSLGMMLNKKGAYREAKSAFLRAYARTDKGNMRRMAISLMNIALCDLNLKDYDSALVTVDSALLYAKKAKVPPIMAHAMGLKSDILHSQKNFTLWEPTLDTAIAISLEAGNVVQAAYGMVAKLDHYILVKNYPKALYFGEKAHAILENADQFPILQKNYKGLYTIHKATGNYEQALFFIEKYLSLKDSLDNAQFDKKMQELNLKYEVADKENKIYQQELEIKKSRIWLIALSLGTLLFGALVFFIAWKNAFHKKNIQQLFRKERELEKEVERLQHILAKSPSLGVVTDETDDGTPNFYFKRIQSLIEKEKLYLNPDFSREDLAQILGTNRSYLSQAINDSEGGGFRMLINKYRVNEAKSIIWSIAQKTSDIPVTKIWESTGFNSNQSFYRIFKSLTNLTPKEYLDEVIREVGQNNRTPEQDTDD
jgi:AraC-like DNA-binding protein